MQARFGRLCCRETIRAALHRLDLSWRKAKKLLGRADPARRDAFVEQLRPLLDGAQRDRHQLVYLDEAHIHQDVDLGYGWGERGQRLFVASSSPGLSAKVSFYGLYLYNEGQVRMWPYPRANGEHTIDVLHRLRAEIPDGKLIVVWDGAPYHRAKAVWAEAASLGIELAPLPGYSPDLMPVEALWRWLREDGALCRAGEAIAYCNVGLTPNGEPRTIDKPFARRSWPNALFAEPLLTLRADGVA